MPSTVHHRRAIAVTSRACAYPTTTAPRTIPIPPRCAPRIGPESPARPGALRSLPVGLSLLAEDGRCGVESGQAAWLDAARASVPYGPPSFAAASWACETEERLPAGSSRTAPIERLIRSATASGRSPRGSMLLGNEKPSSLPIGPDLARERRLRAASCKTSLCTVPSGPVRDSSSKVDGAHPARCPALSPWPEHPWFPGLPTLDIGVAAGWPSGSRVTSWRSEYRDKYGALTEAPVAGAWPLPRRLAERIISARLSDASCWLRWERCIEAGLPYLTRSEAAVATALASFSSLAPEGCRGCAVDLVSAIATPQ